MLRQYPLLSSALLQRTFISSLIGALAGRSGAWAAAPLWPSSLPPSSTAACTCMSSTVQHSAPQRSMRPRSDRALCRYPRPQVASNKRYAGNTGWTVKECAEKASGARV